MTSQQSLSFKINALLEYAAAVCDQQDKDTITSAVNSLLDNQELNKATSAWAQAIYNSVDTNWASGHPEMGTSERRYYVFLELTSLAAVQHVDGERLPVMGADPRPMEEVQRGVPSPFIPSWRGRKPGSHAPKDFEYRPSVNRRRDSVHSMESINSETVILSAA
ncbi:hypothetical protein QFC20_007771 [Naganishia adeliensis]|uniref:Uncharacterized protein n=1 Tax=Naganishia adeliensis TaxID=92952 RepID=A0ACC2UWB3_9TREE|nr:hypothetical protein QFC20_007771 [Naganishia adeliensis]